MISSVLLVFAVLASGVEPVTLGEEAWNGASPASALTAHAPVRRLVQALETSPEAVLVIRHASGETDRTRAAGLQAALVALGIPVSRLRLEPAAAPAGALILELAGSGLR